MLPASYQMELNELPGQVNALKFVLRIILFLSAVATLLAVAVFTVSDGDGIGSMAFVPLPVMLLALLSFKYLKKRNYHKYVSSILVVVLSSGGLVTLFLWGFDAPIGISMLILSGAVTAVLQKGKGNLLIAYLTIVAYVVLALAQASNYLIPQQSWKQQPYSFADIIIYSVTMAAIFGVTWLFNRQLHDAYLRSKASEKALHEQSIHLEELAEQRTVALQKEYAQRLTDLHRFVLFGKEAAGLMHDILNPVSALSVQLETMEKGASKANVKQAQETLARLEGLIQASRRQIRQGRMNEAFDVRDEILRVFKLVQTRADALKVKLKHEGEDITQIGDPILFSKIIQNLIVNALDACERASASKKTVIVETAELNEMLSIMVTDTGCGVPEALRDTLFEPYTTSKHHADGAGLGLSLIRELIEDELQGSIELVTTSEQGTTFHVALPLKRLASDT